MKDKCSKCNDDKIFSTQTEAGDFFHFCQACTHALDQMNQGNKINLFLGEEKKESWVDKNMREARERRKKGVMLWS